MSVRTLIVVLALALFCLFWIWRSCLILGQPLAVGFIFKLEGISLQHIVGLGIDPKWRKGSLAHLV